MFIETQNGDIIKFESAEIIQYNFQDIPFINVNREYAQKYKSRARLNEVLAELKNHIVDYDRGMFTNLFTFPSE